MQWSEVFDHFQGKLNKQTIVHIWKSVTNVTSVVALGYDTLVRDIPPGYGCAVGCTTGGTRLIHPMCCILDISFGRGLLGVDTCDGDGAVERGPSC